MNDLERELEFELHRVLEPISRVAIPPRRSPAHGTYLGRLMGGAGSALAVKVLTGVAVAAAAATVATAATTGTLDPSQWSQGISEKVETCKTDFQGQGGGIGTCVSVIAQHHGSNPSNDERHHGNAGGNSQGNPNGAAASSNPNHGQGQGKDKSKVQTLPTPKGK